MNRSLSRNSLGACSTSSLGSVSDGSVSRRTWLLPATTENLLCNWSPVSKAAMEVLLGTLAKLWGRGKACGKFVDLGCGDGRVVLEVCKAFPDIQGLGVD